DRTGAVEGEGDVEVEDGASGGAAGGDAQAEADVFQDLPVLPQGAVALGEGVHEPGLAGVEEGRGAQMDQVEDLAVAVEALLQGQEDAAVARLVAQRIAAQAAVAAEEELVLAVQAVGEVGAERGVEDLRAEVAQVVAQAPPGHQVL